MNLTPFRAALVQEMVAGFESPETLRTWTGTHIRDENTYNIITGTTLNAQALAVLDWAEARGRALEVLQALVDDPPMNGPRMPVLIHEWTLGLVISAISRQSGIPPIDPHNDWFVTRRPFVNRCELRRELEKLATAPPGPDSVLFIEGPDFSGKSLSIQFAARCAPPQRYEVVDLDDWGGRKVPADELAASMFRKSQPPPVDPTKEDAAVTPLMNWLKGQLHGSSYWILIDHCNRPSLTTASADLLRQLAADIERGYLAGVRLILADVDRTKLPGRLAKLNRGDLARLPDRAAVEDWCSSLAKHMKRAYGAADCKADADKIFSGFPTEIAGPDLAAELEERLLAAFTRIQALGVGGTDGIEDRQIA